MRYKIILLTLIAALALLAAWLDYSHGNPVISEKTGTQANALAPDFSFTAIDSDVTKRLHSLKGKPLLLNFGASWCTPCAIEMPLLVEFALSHPQMVLLLVLADNDPAKARAFAEKYKALNQPNIIVIWDQDKYISRHLYQSTYFPESIIIRPDLTIANKIVGMVDEASLNQMVEDLLP